MARKPRIEFSGACYHVISRGNQRQAIFRDNPDRSHYLNRLEFYRKRYGFQIFAYVLMTNHVHLLIETGSVPLSKIMQGLQFTYTQYFNRKYGKVGHLFQGRYKAILCDRDAYLLELVRYIHLNPARVRKPVDPFQFAWSSHAAYMGGRGMVRVQTTLALAQWGRAVGVARREYVGFLKDGMSMGHQDQYYAVVDGRMLGGERFVEEIRKKTPKHRRIERGPIRVGMSRLLREVARVCNVDAREVRERSYGRRECAARRLFVFVARGHAGLKVREISEFLGRDSTQISHLQREYQENPNSNQVEAVLKSINSHA